MLGRDRIASDRVDFVFATTWKTALFTCKIVRSEEKGFIAVKDRKRK